MEPIWYLLPLAAFVLSITGGLVLGRFIMRRSGSRLAGPVIALLLLLAAGLSYWYGDRQPGFDGIVPIFVALMVLLPAAPGVALGGWLGGQSKTDNTP